MKKTEPVRKLTGKIHSSYLFKCFNQKKFERKIERLLQKIEKSGIPFEAVAFCGASGMLVGPIIAMRLKKHMLLVRKGATSHSAYKVEGLAPRQPGRYIIVDDFMNSGRTCESIIKKVARHSKNWTCVGIALYERFDVIYTLDIQQHGEDTEIPVLNI